MGISRWLGSGALFVGLLISSVDSSVAAERDPAPIPDEVIQAIVPQLTSDQMNPIPELLRKHLDETSALLSQIDEVDRDTRDTPDHLRERLDTKRMFLQGKRDQIEMLRGELETQFARSREQLVASGRSDQVAELDAFRDKVRQRFDRIRRAVDDVTTTQDKGERGRKLARAREDMRQLHERPKAASAPPQDISPTFRMDVPTNAVPDRDPAPPPQYFSSLETPLDPNRERFAFWGKALLVSNPPPSTPSEAATCSYTAQDLAENRDVQLTPEIRALAEQLKYSPVQMFQYVANNIKYEPYYGSLKGAMGTLVSGGGNATDQASLLIALFRASNIPTRYVKGLVQSYDERVQRWVGAKSYVAANEIMKLGKIPTATLLSNGTPTGIEWTHVWVEACVPYGNYRGAAVDLTGHRWIPLDPSFKDQTYQPGIVTTVNFDFDSYLSQRTDVLPHEAYAQQVEAFVKTVGPNFANNTLQDVGYIGTPIPIRLDVLPASLPFRVASFTAWTTGGLAETAEIPDRHRYKFEISWLGTGSTPSAGFPVSLWMPEVVLKRITLSFKPAPGSESAWNSWFAPPTRRGEFQAMPSTLPSVVPIIKVEGVNQVVGTVGVSLGSYTKLELKVILDELSSSTVNSARYTNIRAGGYHALQGYAFQASDQLLKQRATQLLSAAQTPSLSSLPTYDSASRDALQGEFLHLAGLKFMRHVTDVGRYLGALDGTTGLSGNHLGLTSSDMYVQYLFDLPFAVLPGALIVDVPAGISRSVNLATGLPVWKNFLLAGYAGSAYEHYLWQENARLDAISSVRGIQFARETGIEVLNVNTSNWASEKCKLTNTCTNTALNTNPTGLNYTDGTNGTVNEILPIDTLLIAA